MARRRIVVLHLLRGWPGMTSAKVGVWVESDAPADLKVVGCVFDPDMGVIRVAVESETFPDIPDGYFAPQWEPVFTKHYDEMTVFEAAMAVLGGRGSVSPPL